jgi:hypothetical protein
MKQCPYERGNPNGTCNESKCEFWVHGEWIEQSWECGHCNYERATEVQR